MEKKIWHNIYSTICFKSYSNWSFSASWFWERSHLWLKLNLQSCKIWPLENRMEENLAINWRICSKSCSNWIYSAQCFRERSRFWLKSNLQSSKSGISRIERRRKFDTTFCSKRCSNWICSVSCFWQISRFLTEIKPSKLQSGISRVENRTEKKFDTVNSRHWFEALQIKLSVRLLPRQK